MCYAYVYRHMYVYIPYIYIHAYVHWPGICACICLGTITYGIASIGFVPGQCGSEWKHFTPNRAGFGTWRAGGAPGATLLVFFIDFDIYIYPSPYIHFTLNWPRPINEGTSLWKAPIYHKTYFPLRAAK